LHRIPDHGRFVQFVPGYADIPFGVAAEDVAKPHTTSRAIDVLSN
jgi:hypothetical protein